MACDLDYFSLYAIGRIIETEPLIHIPRLYWAGFSYALYKRSVKPCRGLFILGVYLFIPLVLFGVYRACVGLI